MKGSRECEKIRGYLFNLIVYTDDPRREKYFHHIVHTFIENYPCRVIFIHGDPQFDGDYLKIHENENGAESKCDQLTISVSHSRLLEVPFLILTHLIPDLPIYLVWGQDATSDNHVLPPLQKLATRLVFDSECSPNLQEFAKGMLKKIHSSQIEFMDVGWGRIAGWRDVIAQNFNSPEEIHYLSLCSQIEIHYNKINDPLIQHHATQAIYLQCWLAAQLKWSYQGIQYDQDAITIHYKASSNPISIKLISMERPTLPQGTIFEISFHGHDQVTTTLSLAEKLSKVMVYLSTPEKCELPYSLPILNFQKGLTAIKEIFYYNPTDHYQHMLEMLKQIEWKEF